MSKVQIDTYTDQSGKGAPNLPHGAVITGVLTATSVNQTVNGNVTVSGNVGISGTITYEDATDIDSVGIVTARSGIKVGAHAGVGLTIFTDGSINSSGIITASNVSVASSVTATTFHGNGANLTGFKSGVLERVSGQCDGSTRSCSFGTFTFPTVTATQTIDFNSYTKLNSSEITYKPPSGCIGVMYEHSYLQFWLSTTHSIQHHKLFIDGAGDGISGATEITYTRYNTSETYAGALVLFRWYFRIRNDGGSFTTTTGALPSWNNNHTIYIMTRQYSGGNACPKFHQTSYWDGEGSVFHQPSITITAYGPTT